MDVPVSSLLTDIASLWILALVVVVAVLAWLFRDGIRKRLDEGGVTVERGDTRVEISPTTPAIDKAEAVPPSDEAPPPHVEASAVHEPEVPSEPREEADATENDDEADDPEPQGLTYDQVFDLLREGAIDDARRIFDELTEEENTDEEARLRNDVIFAYWRYSFTKAPAAAEELRALADDERVRSLALRLLAFEEREAGLFDRALTTYQEAVGAATRPDDEMEATIGAARCLDSLDQTSAAIDMLTQAVSKAPTDAGKLRVFTVVAAIYRERGDWLMRALALEKALEASVNTALRRFEIGYAYAQADRDDMALLHYSAAVALDPDYAMAHNNIGVAYDALDMPTKAVRSFQRAKDQGETLSAANLGSRLLNAGFVDEAREILNEAMGTSKPHQNVATNLAALDRRAAADGENLDSVLSDAQRERDFLRQYATCRFTDAPLPDVAGNWTSDGKQVEIVQDDASFAAAFEVNDKPARYEGELMNRSCEITYLVEEFDVFTTPMTKDFKKKGTGRGYIDDEGHMILAIEEGSTRRTQRLARVV
jgi:tetratricopeptide (TPR) repeat protein